MAINWFTEAEAEKLFEETFIKWSTSYGYKGCYSPEATRRYVTATRAWAYRSPTAHKILNFVQESTKEIVVVGMRGGYQCFNSTEGPDKNLPVVFIDLDGKLTVNVRVHGEHGNLHLDPERCTGETKPMDNGVAILHEFGHAKQWVERPLMFDNHFKHSRGNFAKAIREKALEKEVGRNAAIARLRPKNRKKVVAIREIAKEKANDVSGAHYIRSLEQVQEFQPPKWGTNIEMDNMSRHEWPICQELGLSIRENYRDINCTSDGEMSSTSIILDRAIKARQEEEAKQKAQENELAKLRTGQVICPVCNQKFRSSVMLRAHAATCK